MARGLCTVDNRENDEILSYIYDRKATALPIAPYNPIRKDGFFQSELVIVAPVSPPFGGMANQADLLKRLLTEKRIRVTVIPTNRSLPFMEPFIKNVPIVRTLLREVIFLMRLITYCRPGNVLYILACSHYYYLFNVIPAVIIGKILCRRVVVNYRGGEAKKYFKNAGKRFLWVLKKADCITVPSPFLKNIFKGFGIRSKVLPNIVDHGHFQYRSPRSTTKCRYICTRNIEPYYDIETAVRAFKIVKEKIHYAKLTLIGDGSLRPVIESLIKEFELEEDVELLGRVQSADIPKHLSESDIFINPSRVDNYPNSILEAFSVGIPVVTTSAGGIPYLVQDQKDVLMGDPGDYRTMARNMIRLAEDPQLCARLSEAGKKTADRHGWDMIWPQMKRELWT